MKLTKIAGIDCKDGVGCPTVYATDRDSVVVQGYPVTKADGLSLPPDEGAVEISRELYQEAARAAGW